MEVKIESTPNPNAMKFTSTSGAFFEGRVICNKGDKPDHPLLQQILEVDGVDNIFGYDDFITVNKTFSDEWDQIMPTLEQIFKEYN